MFHSGYVPRLQRLGSHSMPGVMKHVQQTLHIWLSSPVQCREGFATVCRPNRDWFTEHQEI